MQAFNPYLEEKSPSQGFHFVTCVVYKLVKNWSHTRIKTLWIELLCVHQGTMAELLSEPLNTFIFEIPCKHSSTLLIFFLNGYCVPGALLSYSCNSWALSSRSLVCWGRPINSELHSGLQWEDVWVPWEPWGRETVSDGKTDRSWGRRVPPALGNRMTKANGDTVTKVGRKPVGKVILDRAGLSQLFL